MGHHHSRCRRKAVREDAIIPREHLQSIVNTAAFQMPTVEQGGGSLCMALPQRATDVEVLRLLISMGPIESMHFQTCTRKLDWCGR
jgi:hypothetical protein